MLKRDLIMVQIEELGKMVAQVIFNRNNNAAGKIPADSVLPLSYEDGN